MYSYCKLIDTKALVKKTSSKTIPVKVVIDGELRGGITTENFCGNFCPRGPQGCCTYTPTYNLFDLAYMLSIDQEEFVKEVLFRKPLTIRKYYIQVNPDSETGICQFHDLSSGCTLEWALRSRTCRRSACSHMEEMILKYVHYQSDNEREFKTQREFKKLIKKENPFFNLKDYLKPVDNAESDKKIDQLINYLREMWGQFPLQEKMAYFKPTETHDFIIETKVKHIEETKLYEELEVEAIKI